MSTISHAAVAIALGLWMIFLPTAICREILCVFFHFNDADSDIRDEVASWVIGAAMSLFVVGIVGLAFALGSGIAQALHLYD